MPLLILKAVVTATETVVGVPVDLPGQSDPIPEGELLAVRLPV